MNNQEEGKLPAIPLEDYRRFISQIEIRDVRLVKAGMENRIWPQERPAKLEISVKRKPAYSNGEGTFACTDSFAVTVRPPKSRKVVAKLSVVFVVTYGSEIAMDDRLFGRFEAGNLLVNTWPYFREFAQSSFVRMNMPIPIAPVMKVGTHAPPTGNRRVAKKK